MTYGIYIKNNSNNLIISEDYSNYFVHSSGIYPNGSEPNYGDGVDDIVLVRPHLNGYAVALEAYASGGTNDQCISTSGYVEWVLLRKGVATSGTFGMRIYRADGSLAFDSNGKPLCPVAVLDFSKTARYAVLDHWMPYGVPAGKKRYVSRTTLRIIAHSSGPSGSYGVVRPECTEVRFLNDAARIQLYNDRPMNRSQFGVDLRTLSVYFRLTHTICDV